ALDGGQLCAAHVGERDAAAPDRLAVGVHGAGATESAPAAEFRAGESEPFAQRPKEWGVAGKVESVPFAVHLDPVGHGPSNATAAAVFRPRFARMINASAAPARARGAK